MQRWAVQRRHEREAGNALIGGQTAAHSQALRLWWVGYGREQAQHVPVHLVQPNAKERIALWLAVKLTICDAT